MTRATRESFYESIADRFEGLDHPADVRRRLSVVFDECLRGISLTARRTLDAGCGYGAFSAAATARGAGLVSLDIGPRLVACAMARAGSRGVAGDPCRLPIRDESFDVVISSEMLEHTPEPVRAIGELARVLRTAGLLVLTTPNRVWQAPVRVLGGRARRPRPRRISSVAFSAGLRDRGTKNGAALRRGTCRKIHGQPGARRAKGGTALTRRQGTSTIAMPHGSLPAGMRLVTRAAAVSITATSPARPTVT